MANPYEVSVQNNPAINVIRIVASGMSRRGVRDSSATGATASTPAIDRNAKIAARLRPEKPAVAAAGLNGVALKCPRCPPLVTMTMATAAMKSIAKAPPPMPVQVVADRWKYVSSALKKVANAGGYKAVTTT